jgi:uncharacterized protein YbcI
VRHRIGDEPGPARRGEEHFAHGPSYEIRNALVRLLHERAGRGPTEAKAVISRDQVVVTLRDCLTIGEKTLADAGRTEVVLGHRRALNHALRAEACAVVEQVTGKRVIAYLADQHHDPDIHARLRPRPTGRHEAKRRSCRVNTPLGTLSHSWSRSIRLAITVVPTIKKASAVSHESSANAAPIVPNREAEFPIRVGM